METNFALWREQRELRELELLINEGMVGDFASFISKLAMSGAAVGALMLSQVPSAEAAAPKQPRPAIKQVQAQAQPKPAVKVVKKDLYYVWGDGLDAKDCALDALSDLKDQLIKDYGLDPQKDVVFWDWRQGKAKPVIDPVRGKVLRVWYQVRILGVQKGGLKQAGIRPDSGAQVGVGLSGKIPFDDVARAWRMDFERNQQLIGPR